MTNDLNIKFPKAPGLTLEQAKETAKEIEKMKNELGNYNTVAYHNWPNKKK